MSKEENKILERFSGKVANYEKYRPHYPEELFCFLEEREILKEGCVIADIGSGTGIFSKPFLKRGYTVFGVEPNKEMRAAAEINFCNQNNFKSVNGTAEGTFLPNNTIDVIVVAQAFHWFNLPKTFSEFKRILKPNGTVALVWNDRRIDSTDFLKVYEDFLKMFGIDYLKVNHKNIQQKKTFDQFFGSNNYQEKKFYNFQELDFAGLKGRVLSSSYIPNEQHIDFEFMINCLKKIFIRYQENGKVRLDYDTKIYYGNIKF